MSKTLNASLRSAAHADQRSAAARRGRRNKSYPLFELDEGKEPGSVRGREQIRATGRYTFSLCGCEWAVIYREDGAAPRSIFSASRGDRMGVDGNLREVPRGVFTVERAQGGLMVPDRGGVE